ncbi:hypothetical protein [Streptomyces gelaticus]|uniref:hypothetical protein n=1 Tax=Streptomyces gelaticus TaxID=285446 RepID=UPI00167823A5|nr:hypothetical protein [Streptomyces gelaticus]
MRRRDRQFRRRLRGCIRDDVHRGEFRSDDPYAATMQILVVIDGPGAHAGTGTGSHPEVVTRMAVSPAERELGLENGTLTRRAAALGVSGAS